MLILDGHKASQFYLEDIQNRANRFMKKTGRRPGLAVFLVGEDKASHIYVQKKIEACKKWGFASFKKSFDNNISFADLEKEMQVAQASKEIDAMLFQLPLPDHLIKIINDIPQDKDADGLSPANLSHQFSPSYISPCTPLGVIKLLQFYKIPLAGKKVVIVGRSRIVGLPLFHEFIKQNATVTLCHSKTKNLFNETKQAEIVVACAGKKHLITSEALSPEAVVVDVGIHRDKDNKISGDVNTKNLQVAALSPVPGGVGPMTIAMLLSNTLKLAEKSLES